MSTSLLPPLPDDWAERDCWASWWLAHSEIGRQVRDGERELPELFRPWEAQMRVLDPGHLYSFDVLDGIAGHYPTLRFVKRIGERYPGNEPPGYAGTTLQEVLRALIDRAEYVNGQIPCAETEASIGLLKSALMLFEIRAKRIKGKCLDAETITAVIDGECCPKCGHVQCGEHENHLPPREMAGGGE